MTKQREFASALAKTQHTAKHIHNLVNQAFPNKGLSLSQCYRIVENVKKAKVWRKRPEIAASPWLFHWDNAPVHTANNVTKFLAKNNIRTFQHPPYSPDLAPADYFLFRRQKSDLAGVSVTPETFKTELEQVLRSIGENEFAEAFQSWLHRHEKCIALQGGYVEKS
jgi:histone-lysine N-methyltransferase SETMAR